MKKENFHTQINFYSPLSCGNYSSHNGRQILRRAHTYEVSHGYRNGAVMK